MFGGSIINTYAVTGLIRNDMACSVVPCFMRTMMAIFLRKSISLSAAAAMLVSLSKNPQFRVAMCVLIGATFISLRAYNKLIGGHQA